MHSCPIVSVCSCNLNVYRVRIQFRGIIFFAKYCTGPKMGRDDFLSFCQVPDKSSRNHISTTRSLPYLHNADLPVVALSSEPEAVHVASSLQWLAIYKAD